MKVHASLVSEPPFMEYNNVQRAFSCSVQSQRSIISHTHMHTHTHSHTTCTHTAATARTIKPY